MAELAEEPIWRRGLDGSALAIAQSKAPAVRVCAGPGTGKTFALMRRVCQLVESGADPTRIFVVTFTRTAAHDLREQLRLQDVAGVELVRASTLHSYYFRTLSQRSVLEVTGRVPRPVAEFEQRFLLHDLKRTPLRPVRKCAEMLKAFEANWARLQNEEPGWPHNPEDQEFHNELMEWLKLHECMLLGELGNEMRAYLTSNPGCPERTEFDYILVDEYQDLNRADQSIIDMLAESAQLLVIGDEDQSIYSTLRYAQPEGIRTFIESHPGTEDLPLSVCRRCPTNVVAMANSLIQYNRHREPRLLEPFVEKDEGPVHIVQYRTLDEEAAGIADMIKIYMENTETPPEEVLVLVPRQAPAALLKAQLNGLGIKAHTFFFSNSLKNEIGQRAFTLLTLLANASDRVAMRCWLGLGHHDHAVNAYRNLRTLCDEREIDILDGLELLLNQSPRPSWSNVLVDRYSAWKDWREVGEGLTNVDLVDFVFPENEEALEELRRLALLYIDEANEDVTADTLLHHLHEQINYPEPPSGNDYVRIMSPYKSKGLTARFVVVASCVEGWIPSLDNDLPLPAALRQEEEQRRLFYVAITRCTEGMIISSFDEMSAADARRLQLKPRRLSRGRAYGLASRFLSQLGPAAPTPVRG